MKKIFILTLMTAVFSCFGYGQTNSKKNSAVKLANKVATAFSLGIGRLDRKGLLHGKLQLTMQNWIAEPEFEYRSFRSFAAMQRWMKHEENQPGFPVKTSGKKVSYSRGLCKLDLVDNQMAHNHVFLTRMSYGYWKGHIYIKKLRILYG